MATSGRVLRVALYCRVSSEEQAERETIEAQQTYLRTYASCDSLSVVREYAEEVTGTLPLSKRPQGKQLLADAQAKRFDMLIVHRIDRLGRTLQTILDAHEGLGKAGVAIRSATEPFDTCSPVGVFLFQFLELIPKPV
jgi:site-specific DNA recombinase